MKNDLVEKKFNEICVMKWTTDDKEIDLIKRQVNETQYDLVWQVVDKKTKQGSQKIAKEDLYKADTYMKYFPNDASRGQFKQVCGDVLDKVLKIFRDNSIAARRQLDLSEEVQMDYLRSIPIENRISHFMDQEIRLASDGFPKLKKITANSRFDKRVLINRNTMAVTIIARKGWYGEGHAMIAYEGIHHGKPFIRYAHLQRKGDWGCVSNIEEDQMGKGENIAQSTTWQRDSWKVCRMTRKINFLEKEEIKIPFTLLGKSSILHKAIQTRLKNSKAIDNRIRNGLTSILTGNRFQVEEEDLQFITHSNHYNCLDWAIEMVGLADIIIERPFNFIGDVPAWDVPNLKDIRDPTRDPTCIIC